ncbi:MAG TPA: phosphoribosylglycinamide formyltransferase [Bacteroidales bacterium]|nr:phosphoribosylglycinamide formyltransferase [Bacteroidales bacterium]
MIAVITYDHPHRKTQDLLFRLMLSGYIDIDLIVLPWQDRPETHPLYRHRPLEPVDISIEKLCSTFNLNYYRRDYNDLGLLQNYSKILIAGTGILPEDVTKYKIINSHPGYLPNVRGLDALKWAILNGQPIGVTTHFIGAETDTGILIERRILPIYHTDTFHSIALRQYETEIDMLVNSLSIEPEGTELKAYREYPVNKRMGAHDEIRMMSRLNKLIGSQ